ncbi:hypothetical protein ACSFA3_07280 [Variovorax sp. RHLX14]|uniref:hypothetical protein n=1 Tax=Variovorax sp. RHLX14 TaxID=1259731 RepID=UPI003F486CD8
MEITMILVKTEAGQQVFRDRSVRLTPRQRSAFILFDGRRSTHEILQACDGVADTDIETLLTLGLLDRAVSSPGPASAPLQTDAQASVGDRQQRYKDAYPVAMRLAGSLGLRGFRLNLAIEGATSFEQLLALAPRIRAAVGDEKAAVLDAVLGI